MRKQNKILLLLLCPMLMVGCSKVDIDSLKKNTDISNKKIESMMKDYDNSKFKATKFYESTLDYLSGKKDALNLEGVSNDYKDYIVASVDSYKEEILRLYEDEKLYREEREMEVESLEDFIKGESVSYYFLNEKEGTLEQDICYKFPYGRVLGLQIDWLGGEVFGFQTYSNN